MIRSIVSMIYITNECFLGGNMIPITIHININNIKIKINIR